MIISILSNKLFMYCIIRLMMLLLLTALSLYQKKLSATRYVFLAEQNTSFECGFDQFEKKYLGFCVQFIKTAFLFLMVDLEIALLLPLFLNRPLYEKGYLLRLTITLLVIISLLLMLAIELLLGGLRWREDL